MAAAFREIKDRYIKVDAPAWTILGVAALARPTLFVEIKAVAATRAAANVQQRVPHSEQG
ncbi:RidA family protein [Paraburkholderia elongata]|uniref:Uncharacterized protein n=1 Tax=Paraburkholderia elongata TaxID=2675747 RepID=A0A972NP94_9BURK|nr:hypothetical protein [Paraburkholderia elongata]NPT55175.1 hypothetical protein [Paraburkholderia elongata]